VVPVRSHAPEKLICEFHELAEGLNGLECGEMSPALNGERVRAFKIQRIVQLETGNNDYNIKKGPK
jgi:hypothetical protein